MTMIEQSTETQTIEEQENHQRLLVALGKQTLRVLNDAGIANLTLRPNGSVSGERNTVMGLPQVDYVDDIHLYLDRLEEKIKIGGIISNSITDVGKII